MCFFGKSFSSDDGFHNMFQPIFNMLELKKTRLLNAIGQKSKGLF